MLRSIWEIVDRVMQRHGYPPMPYGDQDVDTIKVTVDTSRLVEKMGRYQRNLAYSTAQALNDTAKEIQARVRADMRQQFKLRRASFMERRIKIMEWANARQGKPYAVVGVDMKARLLLPIFEEGGAKKAAVGVHVAVPVTGQAARRSFEDSVSKQYRFSALAFQQITRAEQGRMSWANRRRADHPKHRGHAPHADDMIWVGRHRTFMLRETTKAAHGGVFQRVGPGRNDLREIYSFKQNPRLPKRLSFLEIARATYEQEFMESFYRRFYRLGRAG